MDIAKIRKKAAQARKAEKPFTKEPSRTETENMTNTESSSKGKPLETEKQTSPEGPPPTASPDGTSDATEEEFQVETAETTIGLLCFQLGPEIYAFHMGDVQEIAHLPAITPVPGTPSYVKGLSSLRGRMVPIMDLKARLHITDIEKSPDADKNLNRVTQRPKIIIVRGPRGAIGVTADRIIGVRRIPGADLNPPPPHITEEAARFIEGIIISEGMFITVLRTGEALGLTITKKGPSGR